MSSDKNNIMQEFEKEMWLYLDKSLPKERMDYWEKQLEQNLELSRMFQETEETLSLYDSVITDDIKQESFERVINAVTKRKKKFSLFKIITKSGVDEPSKHEFVFAKIAFGVTLAVAAVVFLLISQKPNPVKNLSEDILDWDAESITNQISEVETSLLFLKDEKLKKYYMYKMASDKFKKDVYTIDGAIEKIKKELKDKSL